MTQVSEIIVNWTPPESGRVQSVQIQSRIVGSSQWSEQAANFEEEAGTFVFQSNAPASDIEVRMRNRMSNGVFGPWSSATIRSAGEAIFYDKLTGLPTSLGQISPGEGTKLEGIQPGATVGAPIGTNVGGVPAEQVVKRLTDSETVINDIKTVVDPVNGRIAADIKANSDKIDTSVTAVRKDVTDLDRKVSVIENGGGDIGTKITDVITAYKAADKALGERTHAIEATYISTSAATAKIEEAKTALAKDDAAIIKSVDDAVGEYRGLNTTTNTRITNEVKGLADANTAFAGRTSALEASAITSGNSLNRNANFSYWSDANGLPNRWIWWVAAGQVQRYATPNSSGGYAFRHNIPAGYEAGIFQDKCVIHAGWYVLEADIELLDGSLTGAGLTIEGVFNLNFSAEPDVNGDISAGGFRRRRWSKLVKVDRTLQNFHAMSNWNPYGNAYKYVDWFYAGVRAATDGEIKAQKADTALNTPGTGLIAKISSVESVITNLPSNYASASRATVLEASIANDSVNLLRNGTFNQIDPGWLRDGNKHIPPGWVEWASEGGSYIGPSVAVSKYGAKYPVQIDRSGENSGLYQSIGRQAGGWYVVEADVDFEDGRHGGSGIHINFNNGYVINFPFGAERDTSGLLKSDAGNMNRKFSTLFFNGAPTDNANVYLMAGWTGFGGGNGFVRTIWHRAVVRPATDGEIKGRNANAAITDPGGISAKITNLETVTTNGTFAAASTVATLRSEYDGTAATVRTTSSALASKQDKTGAYWQVLADAGNGRAQLTVAADNYGGVVDIVGNVRIGGDLLVSGSVTSGKLGPSSVQQVAFYTLGYDIAIPRGAYGGGGYGGGGGGSGGGGYNNPGTNIP